MLERRLGRLRQHAGRAPPLAADADHDRATSASSAASYTVDFHAIDPTVRRGEQSYPVESNGTLYMTTNDDNVWALDALTGKVKWRWMPDDVAVFRNFGIVANRGVALCDGHVFVLTLDMTIVVARSRRPGSSRSASRSRRPSRAPPRTTATRRRARRSARTTA